MAGMWNSWEVLRVFDTFYYEQRQGGGRLLFGQPDTHPHDTFKIKITAFV